MSWNVFKFCTALRALGSIMILLVLGIVGLSYYALVVVNYGPALFRGDLNSLTALLVLLLFHSLVIYFSSFSCNYVCALCELLIVLASWGPRLFLFFSFFFSARVLGTRILT